MVSASMRRAKCSGFQPQALLHVAAIHRSPPCKPSPGSRSRPSAQRCRTPFALVVPVASTAGAPAPAALPAAATAASSASSSSATVAGTASAVLASVRGRPHEGEVDVDGLVEELGVVGAVDSGAGLLEGGVLDECVALWSGGEAGR